MAGALWTPNGMVNTEKDVHSISKRELIALSVLDELARREGISLVCKKCDTAFIGQNTGQEDQPGVECGCKQLRYRG